MPSIEVFGGIAPKIPDHLLPGTAAIKAHNVKLWDGKIKPWREPQPLALAVPDALSFHVQGCCYLSWDSCVTAAKWLPDSDRFYITGRVGYPEVVVLDGCRPTYTRLGIPLPATPPILQYTDEPVQDNSSATAYVYTYVNSFGEEGPPSPPSTQITIRDGSTVIVSGFTVPAPEYDVVAIHIYRMETGFRDGREKEQVPITEWLFVGAIAITDTALTDDKKVMALGHVLSTREVREPPAELEHIIAIEGTAMLSGVHRNRVYFTRNLQPWNWAADQDLTLDYNIINYVSVNQTIFASTDGVPYVIDGTMSCEPRKCRSVDGVDTVLPDIACGYAHSATATPFGMVYSSKAGLVLIKPNATVEIVTASWYGSDEWQQLKPETARLVYWRGYLVCCTDAITFMLQLDGETYKDLSIGALTTISDEPIDMQCTDTGELIFLEEGMLKHWNASNVYREYEWISRSLGYGYELGFTAGRIKTTGVVFSMISSDGDVWSRTVVQNTPFRVKRLGRNRSYHIGLRGIGIVEYVKYATSIRGLGDNG